MKRRAIALSALLAVSMGITGCGNVASTTTETAEVETAQTEVTEQTTDKTDPNSPDYVIELDPEYNVPTDELLKTFPIEYQTPANTELSKKIQNRMLNGFNRWNMGYDAWEHWGEVLYHDDSIYNVNGVKLTLEEYQQAMDVSLKQLDIQMGTFKNMILVDDWMAIQYDIVNIDRETGEEHPGTTMEFAKFGDYGELGAKVDEGWGGVKNESYDGTMHFQTEEEQKAQKEFMDELCNTELADTDDLEEKYPVVYPTTIDTEIGQHIKTAILNDFENWNQGYDTWNKWTESFYATDAALNYKGEDISLDEYKDIVKDQIDNTQRVRINNILISEDWAAIHFWTVTTNEDGTKEADNHMQFLHFVQNGDKVSVDRCFMK
jgi:hypothetical protein